ncbi:TonB-dependent hemoglobin/transferrin/lactoferrin family receptor [Bartonella tamiae]|uniref:TonB-dependent heme/hemoglobin receptor family protein n=1 Tax=Bartonella tamiae Th239 TaxID=1094558 RepID=J0QX47_9HYPH|nr:TonB-dependent hemoglobin/transferrin/lactoferrin family receptor [Bartonella tamiae]EJF90616.1 TonB-dependent heme/hemoglobin receptor family protein [Bartonella tamiae Th239]EJF94007.1 TonB-dependent heme/hemoglobin receptor family protein [Bartonella tamiae Th307]
MYIKRRMKWKSCVALSVVCFSMPLPAFSQNNNRENINELDTVIVTSQPQKTLNTPTVLTNRHTAQDIENKQIDDVHDIGRLDPSITYNSTNDSFTIRGLSDNRILTTIDGIRLPWLSDSSRGIKGGISMFDFASLSTIDIINGADSSLYGSGALGGVVALRTLDPEDILSPDKNWGSITKGSYDSIDRSWHIDEAFAVRANQTYALFQGGYVRGKKRENNGLGGGYGLDRVEENPADYDQNNLLFKIYQHIDGTQRLGFTAERFDFDKDIDSLNASTTIYRVGSVKNEQKKRRERLSLSYDYNGGGSLIDEAHAIVYWQRQRTNDDTSADRISIPRGYYSRDNMMRNISFGINAAGLKMVEIGDTIHTLRIATDASSSKFQQYAAGEDSCPSAPFPPQYFGCQFLYTNQSDAPNTDSTSFGISFEDEISFFDNRFRLTPGVRYDWYDHRPQKTGSYENAAGFSGYPSNNSGSRLSPKVRLEWDAINKLTLYAQWAQAFRAPSVTELYLNYTNPGFYYIAGNPELKHETSNGYDIGALLGDNHLGGALSLFSNYYRNFIDTIDYGADSEFLLSRQQYINRARVRISGIEARAHWVLSNGWHTNAALAYAEGKDTETDEHLNSIPALKGVLGVGYAEEKWGSDITLTATAKRNKVEKNSDFAKTPGYTLVDLTGWWEPVGKKGPRIKAGVYNLFDKRYWNAVDLPASSSTPKDYFSEPGRSFKVSIVQKF